MNENKLLHNPNFILSLSFSLEDCSSPFQNCLFPLSQWELTHARHFQRELNHADTFKIGSITFQVGTTKIDKN